MLKGVQNLHPNKEDNNKENFSQKDDCSLDNLDLDNNSLDNLVSETRYKQRLIQS